MWVKTEGWLSAMAAVKPCQLLQELRAAVSAFKTTTWGEQVETTSTPPSCPSGCANDSNGPRLRVCLVVALPWTSWCGSACSWLCSRQTPGCWCPSDELGTCSSARWSPAPHTYEQREPVKKECMKTLCWKSRATHVKSILLNSACNSPNKKSSRRQKTKSQLTKQKLPVSA